MSPFVKEHRSSRTRLVVPCHHDSRPRIAGARSTVKTASKKACSAQEICVPYFLQCCTPPRPHTASSWPSIAYGEKQRTATRFFALYRLHLLTCSSHSRGFDGNARLHKRVHAPPCAPGMKPSRFRQSAVCGCTSRTTHERLETSRPCSVPSTVSRARPGNALGGRGKAATKSRGLP